MKAKKLFYFIFFLLVIVVVIYAAWPLLGNKIIKNANSSASQTTVESLVSQMVQEDEDVNVSVSQVDTSAWNGVMVFVSVRDRYGNPITGLTGKDFLVVDSGILVDRITVTPLQNRLINQDKNFALVMDSSGSMQGKALEDAKQAVLTFASNLNTKEMLSVTSFNTDVSTVLNTGEAKDSLPEKLAEVDAQGGTALYDATRNAIRQLEGWRGRKVVIVFTDGGENSSKNNNLDQLIQFAKTHETTVYAIQVGNDSEASNYAANLKRLATETGGEYYVAPSAADINILYNHITNCIDCEYKIDYRAPLFADNYRFVEITATSEGETQKVRFDYSVNP